jgi:hypothetical protein
MKWKCDDSLEGTKGFEEHWIGMESMVKDSKKN